MTPKFLGPSVNYVSVSGGYTFCMFALRVKLPNLEVDTSATLGGSVLDFFCHA